MISLYTYSPLSSVSEPVKRAISLPKKSHERRRSAGVRTSLRAAMKRAFLSASAAASMPQFFVHTNLVLPSSPTVSSHIANHAAMSVSIATSIRSRSELSSVPIAFTMSSTSLLRTASEYTLSSRRPLIRVSRVSPSSRTSGRTRSRTSSRIP